MKFAVSLAFCDPSGFTELARAAEAAAFDSIVLSDHVVHPEKLRATYPYTPDGKPRWEPFTPWPDPWVAIGAMAAVTAQVHFVTGVYVLPLRNPFLVAKAVTTAAVIAQGRVALGVGAGWMKEEFDLLEQEFRTRGRRMDEMIEVLRKLWRGGWVEHHGEFYDFDRLEMSPVPEEPTPIYVGGLSEPALRRAATRGDGWISDIHSSAELRQITRRLHAYRADSPRAEEPFLVYAACRDAVDLDGYRKLEDVGVTHVLTFPWIFYHGPSTSLAEKLDGIERFGDEIIAKV